MPQTGEGRWTDAFLDSMRQVTDPPADQVVQAIFAQGETAAVNDLMRQLVTNDQIPVAQLPPIVREYLAQTAQLPAWTDPAQLARAADVFGRHGMTIVLALFHASLPASYAAAKGVQVLYLTAQLMTDPRRRIAQTAQFVLDAMAPGGLGPEGDGLRDAQKVRLMHAAVRHLIRHSGRWDPSSGQPINMEDLGGTLLTFTAQIFEALGKLGIAVEPADAEAYLHAWKVIGHVLGIVPEMLPAGAGDAMRLMAAIKRRNYAPSEAGKAMTRALVDLVEHATPGTFFDGLAVTLIRHFLGDEVGDLLGLPAENWTQTLVGPLGALLGRVDADVDHDHLLGNAAAHFSRSLLSGLLWVNLGGQRAPFQIPTTLSARWGLPSRAM